jgi:hypothetical protein
MRQLRVTFLLATLFCPSAIVPACKTSDRRAAEHAPSATAASPVPRIQGPDAAPELPPVRTESANISRCPVHRVPLHEEVVAIEYGKFGETTQYMDDQPRLFPFANEFFMAGCVVGPETKAIVHYCSECRRAKKRWLAERPDLDRFGQSRM